MTTFAASRSLPDPRELTKRDVQLLTEAVLLVVTCAEKIVHECAVNEPPVGSPAFLMFAGEEKGYAMESYLTMQYSNLSGFDHARAFVALIRTPMVRSTSLATVARGATESFARTFYLLSRQNKPDLVYRLISLLRSELRYPELFGEELSTRDGAAVDPTVKRAFYAAELERMGLPGAARIELGALVGAMLDSEFTDKKGAEVYSSMSASAHAHRLAINTFVVTHEKGEIAGLRVSRSTALELALYIISSVSAVMNPHIELFGNTQRHRQLFRAAELRAIQALNKLDADKPPASE
jgi:hypothetical protein